MNNILENNVNGLNEIIFENRNKSYGAYTIRSMYTNTIVKSLGITVLIFASVSIIALMISNTTPEDKVLDTGTNIIPEIIYNVDVDISPLKKIEATSPKQDAGSISKTMIVSTIIKDNPTEQVKDQIETTDSPNTLGKKTDMTEPGKGTNSDTKEPGTSLQPAEPMLAPDVLPTFNLGPFLQKNLRYPEMAKEVGVSGRVIVNFIIDEEGNIIKATILKGIGAGCDEEALRVIKLMPKWNPGMNNGKPVKVSFNQSIVFRLQ